ncbi:AtzH-like domain-containing protein [Microbacterium sp. Marseille-Q6965]|uniref:AtzH-like domain-containing protein n=1 Tax=Microbacterium sp. Marseille-Q6965 TaxID=2965072 RepID=UPI0021B79CB4|nr:AtzH-like domain-containing protein [Microbacterium sp. Marseille-Q6965]
MTDQERGPYAGVQGAGGVPEDLLAALSAYERAILTNELDELDRWFLDSPSTLRADHAGLLLGHDEISAFRGLRGGVPARVIERLEYRRLGAEAALVVSVSRFAAGGHGVQTQLWQLTEIGWRIAAAHVSSRPQSFDRSIWRAVGAPLVHADDPKGPLGGLTVAVKDLFAIEGFRIGAGNPAYLDSAAPQTATATAVADLLQGGAAVRGISQTDEFAYSIAGDNPHYGTPPNDALPGALPGGSSSGPASAVAMGQADIGLATDTAGSVRVPASYQGLWGLRTTHGLVPRDGLLPLAPTFDTVGWITRDGHTLQRVADWCLPPSDAGAADHPLPWRIRVPLEMREAAAPQTRAAFDAFLTRLDAPIEQVSIGDLASYQQPFRVVQAAEAWRSNGEWVRAHPGALGPAVEARFREAARVTPEEENAARAALEPLRARMQALVADAQLLFPTVPGHAPSRDADGAAVDAVRTATLRMTTPAAVAGLPALSFPVLRVPLAQRSAPVGVCVVARRGCDAQLVGHARRLSSLA